MESVACSSRRSPPYDPSGITSLLAARTSLDFIGSIFHERAKRRA
jgi:agmatinase